MADILIATGRRQQRIERIEEDYVFIQVERKYFKIYFTEIPYIEGLKK
ncbi:MAG: hypothetical protein ACXWWA_10710 [Chitinophagaceae bacterium]